MSACKVDDCDEKTYGRGYCRSHYMRWWRTGDPLPPRVTHRTKVTPRRFV